MKKVLIILLCVILCVAFAACANDNAKKVKADYNAFEWEKATPAAAKTKAETLIARIDKLTATEQQELKDIRLKLEAYVNADPAPSPSNTEPTTTPSESPSESPATSPTKTPSTNNG